MTTSWKRQDVSLGNGGCVDSPGHGSPQILCAEVWEAAGAKPVERGVPSQLPQDHPWSPGQTPDRHQSSVTGGGMSCSWKFSFWKMLLKAGPLWEPLKGLKLSLLRFWESSVRRASCKGGDTHQPRLVGAENLWGWEGMWNGGGGS